jgi:hypothetical protein
MRQQRFPCNKVLEKEEVTPTGAIFSNNPKFPMREEKERAKGLQK